MLCHAVRCLQAVMWLASGDVRYAANAASIIDAWATTNKKFCGKNAPLVSPAQRLSLCSKLAVDTI
jgi:hypothetical protein